MEPASPTPIAEQREHLGESAWKPEWNKVVQEALVPPMLSKRAASRVKGFCPQFGTMVQADKRAFWAYFFEALASAEAGLNPAADMRHTEPQVAVIDTVTGRWVRSEGLPQLTYMDAKRYGCNFDWNKDKILPEHDPAKTILQPINNLKCGITILEDQLLKRKEPLLTRSSYWATLHPGTESFRVFAAQMTDVPAACRLPAPTEEAETKNEPVTVSTPALSPAAK